MSIAHACNHLCSLLVAGDGHFSPIGGYHTGSDHALILDVRIAFSSLCTCGEGLSCTFLASCMNSWDATLQVARFKYAPHWVSLPLLHKAMGFEDAVTGKPRGLLIVGHTLQPSSVLFTLDLRSR